MDTKQLLCRAGRATGALVIVAGLGLATAGSASAVEFSFDIYDVNGDGRDDESRFDVIGPDGVSDQNLVSTPDGTYMWLIDKNQNRVADEVAADTDGDHRPNVWLVDDNEDNVFERAAVDQNRNGQPDGLERPVLPQPPGGGVTLVIGSPPLGSLEDIAAGLQAGHYSNCHAFTWTMPDGWACRVG